MALALPLLLSIDRLWRGRAWGEWTNAAEARPILLLLEWDYRSRLRMNTKYHDLVYDITLRGAFGKERSSNRKQRYVIRRARAYTLAGNLLALLERVRAPCSPAGFPSRRLPQRSSRGALATRNWVQCGQKTDLYGNKAALAV